MKPVKFSTILLLVMSQMFSAVAQEQQVSPQQQPQQQEQAQPQQQPERPLPEPLSILSLPEPNFAGPFSLEESLAARRSVRKFERTELNLQEVGQLAWAGQGITEKTQGFRTAPSAGAIYPLKLYFIIKGGMYVYNPQQHRLEKLLNLDLKRAIADAALRQEVLAKAPCDILIAGSPRKLAEKYGAKARTFMLLEAGHVAQNIGLQAVSLGLGSVSIGAFDEARVKRIARLPAEEEAIYLIAVGRPTAGPLLTETVSQQPGEPFIESTAPKKALLVIAGRRFQDMEFFNTKDILEAAGIRTAVASWEMGVLKSSRRGSTEANILVNEVNPEDYDAIVFIGGPELRRYYDDKSALDIARRAVEKGKVVAALDSAPRILAEADVIQDVTVTANSGQRGNMIKAGGKYTGGEVESDRRIVTGNGPFATAQFAAAVVDALKGKIAVNQQEEGQGRYVPKKVLRRREVK